MWRPTIPTLSHELRKGFDMSLKKAGNEAKKTFQAVRESVRQERAAQQHARNAVNETGKSLLRAVAKGVKNFLDVNRNPPRGGMTHGKR